MSGAEVKRQVMKALREFGRLLDSYEYHLDGEVQPKLAALAPCIVLTAEEALNVRAPVGGGYHPTTGRKPPRGRQTEILG